MGANKVHLLKGDEYAALIAVQQIAELIVCQVRGEPGPVEVRVEDSRFPGWDDLTVVDWEPPEEEFEDPSTRLVAWQVKRTGAEMKREQFVRLLQDLAGDWRIDRGVLGVRAIVPVRKVAPLGALLALCARLATPGLDRVELVRTLTQHQKAWLDLATEVQGGEQAAGLQLLGRIRVEVRGDEFSMRQLILARLALVSDRYEALLDRLRAWGRDAMDPAMAITWDVLEPVVGPYLNPMEDAPQPVATVAASVSIGAGAGTVSVGGAATVQAGGGDNIVHHHHYGDSPEPSYIDDGHRAKGEAIAKLEQAIAIAQAEGGEVDRLRVELLERKRDLRTGPELQAGDTLSDRYKLLEVLGRGGFATVWKAYDMTRRELVAVKALHGQFSRDQTRVDRLFRGARTMAMLNHPAVVHVLEPRAEDGGHHYFVMELLDGGTLRQAVLEKRLNSADQLRVLLQVGEALAAAHALDLVHRDVKPANILLDEVGNAKLTDFDLVRAGDTTGGTRTGAMGTYIFAAPEALSDASVADSRADVYSLAMTAVFCLHGERLSPRQALYRRDKLMSSLPIGLSMLWVLNRGLEVEPEDRTASVELLMDELRAHWTHREPEEPPVSRARPPVMKVDAGPGRNPRAHGRAGSAAAYGEPLWPPVGAVVEAVKQRRTGTPDPTPAPGAFPDAYRSVVIEGLSPSLDTSRVADEFAAYGHIRSVKFDFGSSIAGLEDHWHVVYETAESAQQAVEARHKTEVGYARIRVRLQADALGL